MYIMGHRSSKKPKRNQVARLNKAGHSRYGLPQTSKCWKQRESMWSEDGIDVASEAHRHQLHSAELLGRPRERWDVIMMDGVDPSVQVSVFVCQKKCWVSNMSKTPNALEISSLLEQVLEVEAQASPHWLSTQPGSTNTRWFTPSFPESSASCRHGDGAAFGSCTQREELSLPRHPGWRRERWRWNSWRRRAALGRMETRPGCSGGTTGSPTGAEKDSQKPWSLGASSLMFHILLLDWVNANEWWLE